MALLNTNARRTRDRANDLFGECSDDDLMSWGQALVDAEPFFDDEFGSTFPDAVAAADPTSAPPQERSTLRAVSSHVSAARTIETVLAIGARRARSRRR